MKDAVQWRTALAVRRIVIALMLVGSMMFAGAAAIAQAPPQSFTPEPEDPESFPDGPGRDDAFYACAACHGFKLVAAQGFSRERWVETIELMTERHGMPKLEGKDREIILNYLAATYPPKPPQNRGFQNPFLKQ